MVDGPENASGFRLLVAAHRARFDAVRSADGRGQPADLAAIAREGLDLVSAVVRRNPSLGEVYAHRAAFELVLAELAIDPEEASRRRTAADESRQTARQLSPLLRDPVLDAGASP
jgi:hypothetical protein